MTKYQRNKIIDFALTMLAYAAVLGFGLHLIMKNFFTELAYWLIMAGYCLGIVLSIFVSIAIVIQTEKQSKP